MADPQPGKITEFEVSLAIEDREYIGRILAEMQVNDKEAFNRIKQLIIEWENNKNPDLKTLLSQEHEELGQKKPYSDLVAQAEA